MMKIDKWHIILFIIAILGILGSGFFAGQTMVSAESTTEAKAAYEKALKSQTETTNRLADSLATSNKVTTTNVQGDLTNKGNKSNRK